MTQLLFRLHLSLSRSVCRVSKQLLNITIIKSIEWYMCAMGWGALKHYRCLLTPTQLSSYPEPGASFRQVYYSLTAPYSKTSLAYLNQKIRRCWGR